MNMKPILSLCIAVIQINAIKAQAGPDPWNYDINEATPVLSPDHDIPPDILMALKANKVNEIKTSTDNISELSFKRMLAILLKEGTEEDGNVMVSLLLKFNHNNWNTLNEYVKLGTPLTEDMVRRSLGYVEDSIYKPIISERIIMAWGELIQKYLSEYRLHIGALAMILFSLWIWNNVTHKHIVRLIFLIFYVYEGFISYKETEEMEYRKFVGAVKDCEWYFWTNYCETPGPDWLLFMKHMNPIKVGVRMFASAITEAMTAVNTIFKTLLKNELYWPFDVIIYTILMASVNIFIISLIVMILCNYIFNIPLSVSFGFVTVALKNRYRSFFPEQENIQPVRSESITDNSDRISSSTFDKMLNIVCTQALEVQNKKTNRDKSHLNAITDFQVASTSRASPSTMRKSSSTGRLQSLTYYEKDGANSALSNGVRKRQNVGFEIGGGGDAS